MNPEKHLPAKAPKRTGKRGVKPLDFDSDFEKPTTRQTPMTVGPLAADNPPTPAVQNGRMRVFHGKPTFNKFKDTPLISLHFTMPLEKAHDELLPKIASEAHKDVQKRGRSYIRLKDIPAQHALLFLSSEMKEEIAVLPACKMTGNIAIIERKGEGTARKVVRLAFALQTERSEPLSHFAEMNMDTDFWLEIRDSQETLWDEDEED